MIGKKGPFIKYKKNVSSVASWLLEIILSSTCLVVKHSTTKDHKRQCFSIKNYCYGYIRLYFEPIKYICMFVCVCVYQNDENCPNTLGIGRDIWWCICLTANLHERFPHSMVMKAGSQLLHWAWQTVKTPEQTQRKQHWVTWSCLLVHNNLIFQC